MPCVPRTRGDEPLSGIATPRTLDSFDFDADVDVSKQLIQELATLRFLHQGENVLFLGPPGAGKSHLAIGLGLAAIEQGHRVYFITLHDLVDRSRVARQRERLHDLRADLLILDEGHLPLERIDAERNRDNLTFYSKPNCEPLYHGLRFANPAPAWCAKLAAVPPL